MELYPNPVTDELTISHGSSEINATINIYNVLGEKIYAMTMLGEQATINCKPFAAGVYFVRVTNEVKEWTGKIIIAK